MDAKTRERLREAADRSNWGYIRASNGDAVDLLADSERAVRYRETLAEIATSGCSCGCVRIAAEALQEPTHAER